MFATIDGKKAIRPSNVVNRQILPCSMLVIAESLPTIMLKRTTNMSATRRYRDGVAGIPLGVVSARICTTLVSMTKPFSGSYVTLTLP
jgi:hypothetical protein